LNANLRRLRLKHGQERRVQEGSLWVFSNQVEDAVKDYHPGEIVRVTLRNGRFLGVGYINPHSLIAVRLLTSEDQEIDGEFFRNRFQQARELREKILPGEEAVREIFSESDGLPGLIVDRYGDFLVVQISTAGMERLRDLFVPILVEIYQPHGIFERSDAGVRKLENLESRSGAIWGEIPEGPVWVKYSGLNLPVDVQRGQKTGLYLDQRKNLDTVVSIGKDARVLDAFSYLGAWGLKAAKSGAAQVTFLDSSGWALEQAMAAARRNRLAGICKTVQADAFDALKQMKAGGETFDLVILDPPSFIRSRSLFKEGYKGYYDLNHRAIDLVKPGGFLVTCSCSHHMDEVAFGELLQSVLRRSGRRGRLLFQGRQGPDHPILPEMPETKYLHCTVCQVS
jgi:23S rRNA (cytosine1962-C5)-methyltransferase